MKDMLLNVKQAARILGVKPKTLYQWKWKKQHLKFVKVGKALRVSLKDLILFIEKNSIMPEEKEKSLSELLPNIQTVLKKTEDLKERSKNGTS